MADRVTPKIRSKIMSKIRHKNTMPELTLRKKLWAEGLKGFRLHWKLPGKPDIVYTTKKIVIFIDGDFWHGYNWKKLGKIPPKKYWQGKIQKNIDRAKKYNKILRKEGWKVIRLWEHEINKDIGNCIKRIKKILNK